MSELPIEHKTHHFLPFSPQILHKYTKHYHMFSKRENYKYFPFIQCYYQTPSVPRKFLYLFVQAKTCVCMSVSILSLFFFMFNSYMHQHYHHHHTRTHVLPNRLYNLYVRHVRKCNINDRKSSTCIKVAV